MPEITSQLSTALADRYRIERHIGEGGMATVYLAHDVKHDRKVALKVLRPELAAVIGAERFLNEIKVTANLQHPHILPLHDSGTVSDASGMLLYYVMPYVEGESLRDKLDREKQLGISEALDIAKAVGSALDYAHRQGVIHRDIKPENVLMQDGQAMIADFGIALAVSQAGGSRITETGLSIGTPNYMSPEQAMGDRELDARTDVYSLGAMLYEMLAGDPPYTGSTAQAIVAKVITEKPPLITAARDTVPPHVAATIHMALEKLPADRFNTAAQFTEALSNTSLTMPATAMGISAPGTSGTGTTWNRMTKAFAAVATIASVAAVLGWMQPESSKPVTRYRMMPADPDQSVDLVQRLGGNIALAPDDSRLAFLGLGPNLSQIYVRERDQLDARVIAGTGGATTPTFSPDGERIAFITLNPATLKIVSLGGEPPVALADSGFNRWGLSWGPDGFIYVANQTGPLLRIPETGGTPQPASVPDTTAGEDGHVFPHVLPNGKGVLITIRHGLDLGTAEIGVLNVRTGRHEPLLQGIYAVYSPSGHIVFVRADGALLAAPFDTDALELTGPAVSLFEGIMVDNAGSVDLELSRNGTLTYVQGEPGQATSTAYWVDRDGRAQVLDPNWAFSFTGNGGLSLSPDGTRLALRVQDQTADIWIKDLPDGPATRLTFEGDRNFRPRWTPDGRSVTFLSTRQGSSYDLYQRRADGIGSAELLLDLEARITEAFWGPGGEWIVLRAGGIGGTTGGRDIHGYRPGVDTAVVELVVTSFDEKVAEISRDGRWIAFESNKTGRDEIAVRPFPNTLDGMWQVSSDGGRMPLWSHSGDELFYVNGDLNLVSVAVSRSGNAITFGERRTLFSVASYFLGSNGRHYDVDLDDQRFVFVGSPGGTSAPQLIVVENFAEELKRRMGN